MPKSDAERYLFAVHQSEFERALAEFAERELDLHDAGDRADMASELRDTFWQTKRWKKA